MGKKKRKLLNAKLRRVLSPGDPFRLLVEEMRATPNDMHVFEFGGHPHFVIPADEPGIVQELLRIANEMDGHGHN